MKHYFDMHIRNRKLLKLRPVFVKWQRLMKAYCRFAENEDAPYWYNERTNTGLLACAAWQAGWVALEEYSSTKRFKNEDYQGRVDLYLASENREFCVETKQVWVSLSRRARRRIDKVADALRSARKDAVSSATHEDGRALGVVFVTPYLPGSAVEGVDGKLVEFFEDLWDLDYGASIKCFPKEVRFLADDRGYVFPGVVALLRVPRR